GPALAGARSRSGADDDEGGSDGENHCSNNEKDSVGAAGLQNHVGDRQIEDGELKPGQRRQNALETLRLVREPPAERRAYGGVEHKGETERDAPERPPQRVERPGALMHEQQAEHEGAERGRREEPRPEPLAERSDAPSEVSVRMEPEQTERRPGPDPQDDAQ